MKFNLSKLLLDFDLAYEFVTIPAIMADLGFLHLTLHNLSVNFELTTYFENDSMSLNVSEVKVELEQFSFFIDGINDFIYVVNGFLSRIVGVVAAKTK